ncbi:GTP cyclohydrolase [Haliangium sp. UPWRP_2]|uniref:GTP cyclohydrolase n=1 Tax=Haliangium sp. UPWRP_2 TaxID=1931276 RepID=UPI000D0CF5C5|nr:GTP cyclohydrolase [Haliangium sp. UPWRP_2]PSM30705.1 GTP cyclohydrolase [Haliangium sp. UPWRP_2]
MVIRIAEGTLLTRFGRFLEILYYDGQKESIALVMGDVTDGEDVYCRIHSSCLSAHVFNSIECDCREQMEISQRLIEEQKRGLVIWLDQEGRSNGHLALLRSASLRESGLTQTEAYVKLGYKADARDFSRAAEILNDLKIRSIRLLTNNPDKIRETEKLGIVVSGQQTVVIEPDNDVLKRTYTEKRSRGHRIPKKE